MNRVCAVIVTRNRSALLLRNIRSILGQSVEAGILVFDNASDDDVCAFLKGQGLEAEGLSYGDDGAGALRNNRIVVVRSDENRGGAGGFCEGIRYAYDAGFEYIWLMDDDGYCLNEKTLKLLMDRAGERDVILNSLVVCAPKEEGGDDLFSFSLNGQRYLSELAQEDGFVKGDVSTFNSTLFPRKLVSLIGSVNPDFFIYGDDWDYLERARAAGFETDTLVDSRYFHPDSGMGFRKVLGRLVAFRDMSADRMYYYERNSVYIIKEYRGKKAAWLHVFKVLGKCLLYKGRRLEKTRATVIGLLDGWHGRLKYTL